MIVVTATARAAAVLAGLGAAVVPDQPGQGLNGALRHGAAHAGVPLAAVGIGGLAADLPALRPAELSDALRAAARWPQAFVADSPDPGTTLYAAASAGRHSGRGSARVRPRGTGRPAPARLTRPGLASLRRDVDEPPTWTRPGWAWAPHRGGRRPAGLPARLALAVPLAPAPGPRPRPAFSRVPVTPGCDLTRFVTPNS